MKIIVQREIYIFINIVQKGKEALLHFRILGLRTFISVYLHLCICICVLVFVFVQTGKNHHQRRYCILGYWEHVRPVPSVPRNSNGKDKIMSLGMNLKTM